MRNSWLAAVAVVSLVFLMGCATPESRIKRNPEKFNALSADAQERVRKGEVAVGDPRDAALLALGQPDRMYSRTTEEGVTEIWSYVDTEHRPSHQRADATFRYKDATGRYRSVRDSVLVEVDEKIEYERMRLEMKSGRIVAIEQVQR